uniref:Transposase-associated domain-containing protein n=1 Tax=Lactuca sativa TaxID=4236 RepID=A0A9R1VI18_LACSA|nr:hypothetical protein LSAT_V11C500256480 [Lactuca sativa]
MKLRGSIAEIFLKQTIMQYTFTFETRSYSMEIVEKHVKSNSTMCCPCIKCVNIYQQLLPMVYAHKRDCEFLELYTKWVHHGEKYVVVDLDYNLIPRINTPIINEIFDVIDDFMAEQNTNAENRDDDG